MRILLGTLAAAAVVATALPASAATTVVFQDNFEGPAQTSPGVTANRTGAGSVQSAGTLPGFGTRFFRNGSGCCSLVPGLIAPQATVWTLANLPSNARIDISFELAFIDSWDGISGIPSSVAPDYLFLSVNGVDVAQLWVNNVTGAGGSNLAGGVALNFGKFVGSGFWNDQTVSMASANVLSFNNAGTGLNFAIRAGGAGWQGSSGLTDESWGVDNIRVTATIPEPGAWAMMIGGFGLTGYALRRRRAPAAA